MPRFDAAHIRRYYDRNTPAFVAFGQGGDVGAIHRAVWGPGVTERRQAFHYVEDRIADVMRSLSPDPAPPEGGALRSEPSPVGRQVVPRAVADQQASGLKPQASGLHIVDLGCGVGASICYLAERLPVRATGITLSPAQAALARQRIARLGLSDRVVCLEGDYTNLPSEVAPADVAFAIESFVHALDPDRFFAESARLVRHGGALIICDDCQRPTTTGAAGGAGAIERFCRGWHINSLLTPGELRTRADAAGFTWESTEDLTPYLELGRPRDRLIAALVAPARWLPFRWTRLDPLLGGTALQTCLSKGWMGYELTVFRRR